MHGLEELRAADRTLMLLHWDTDGICSGCKLMSYFLVCPEIMIPTIGMYSLSDEEFERIEAGEFERVIVLDLALPEEDFDRLAALPSEVWVFDHHLKPPREDLHQFNPVARGSPPEEYPSTTWVIYELSDSGLDLLTVLGAVGDKGPRIVETPAYGGIEKYLSTNALSLGKLLRMSELIDSNHRMGDRKAITEALWFVGKHERNPDALLDNERWIENDAILREEIASEERAAGPRRKGIIMHRFSSELDIISPLSRGLASRDDVKASVVIQEGFFPHYDRIYVRTNEAKKDLSPVLGMAEGRGLISGGKREVVGVVIPREKTEDFVNETMRILEAS